MTRQSGILQSITVQDWEMHCDKEWGRGPMGVDIRRWFKAQFLSLKCPQLSRNETALCLR